MSFNTRRWTMNDPEPIPPYAFPQFDETQAPELNRMPIFPQKRFPKPLSSDDIQIPQTNVEGCAAECFQDMLCNGFEFAGAPDNICTLRRGNSDVGELIDWQARMNSASGLKIPVMKSTNKPYGGGAVTTDSSMLYFDVHVGQDMRGKDIQKNYLVPTAQACAAQCYQDELCKGFSWDPTQNNYCTLKSEVYDPIFETNSTVIFGKRK